MGYICYSHEIKEIHILKAAEKMCPKIDFNKKCHMKSNCLLFLLEALTRIRFLNHTIYHIFVCDFGRFNYSVHVLITMCLGNLKNVVVNKYVCLQK